MVNGDDMQKSISMKVCKWMTLVNLVNHAGERFPFEQLVPHGSEKLDDTLTNWQNISPSQFFWNHQSFSRHLVAHDSYIDILLSSISEQEHLVGTRHDPTCVKPVNIDLVNQVFSTVSFQTLFCNSCDVCIMWDQPVLHFLIETEFANNCTRCRPWSESFQMCLFALCRINLFCIISLQRHNRTRCRPSSESESAETAFSS